MREVELRKILEFGARGTEDKVTALGLRGYIGWSRGLGAGWVCLLDVLSWRCCSTPVRGVGRPWALSGVQGRGAGLETARWDGTAQG